MLDLALPETTQAYGPLGCHETLTEGKNRKRNQSRIVHLVPAPFDGADGILGGAERYAFELAKHMARVTPTSLVSFGRETKHLNIGALTVRIIGGAHYVRGSRTNPIAPGLFRELTLARVIHCHQQHVVASSTAAIFGRLTGRRVLVTDMGGGGWDLSSYVSTDRLFHGHLHISEYSQTVAGHASTPNARVILGGVDTGKFHPLDTDERDNVLFVGRLLPHKGINYLIEALPDGMKLEIIGRPYDRAYLSHLEELAQGRNVLFRMEATDDELCAAYQRALCVVLPSVYVDMYGHRTDVPELLGQTLLEGMASGAPVVCTTVGSLPEVVSDTETGLTVPPNDVGALRQALEWLRDHRGAAARMGHAGRQRAIDRFSWHTVVQRCLEAYEA